MVRWKQTPNAIACPREACFYSAAALPPCRTAARTGSPEMPSVASISQQIWDMKYRLKAPNGDVVDKTIEDSWARIAAALAEPEAHREGLTARFTEALQDFRFLPAGRVVAGAG